MIKKKEKVINMFSHFLENKQDAYNLIFNYLKILSLDIINLKLADELIII